MPTPSDIVKKLVALVKPRSTGVALASLARSIVHPTTNEMVGVVNQAGEFVNSDTNGIGRNSRRVYENFAGTDTADTVALILPAGGAYSGATGILHHMYTPGANVFGAFPLGAGQTLPPAIIAAGLDIGGDQTNTEGWEIVSNAFGASGRPFVVGNSGAFFFKVGIKVQTVAGVSGLQAGFRKLETYQAAVTSYSDYASIGLVAGDIYMKTGVGGTDVSTDTTDNFVDGQTATFAVYVSATGVVTYKVNGAAPTTVAAITMTDGLSMVPFVRHLNNSTLAGNVVITNWECGAQYPGC